MLLWLAFLLPANALQAQSTKLESRLEIFTLENNSRQIIHTARTTFEAPNWSRDGKYLIYNSEGRLYKIPVKGGTPVRINTSFADHCNNDHGLSPDGKWIAISHGDAAAIKKSNSRIYVLPYEGGTPRALTDSTPSYWHGWSPDGQTLAYCAERNGEFDVYTISFSGGLEKRLTTAKGLDDGPDYSPDGKYIYFNSYRTGKMKIWRMRPNGSGQEQVTTDDYADWFAHPSPDGKYIVFITYLEDQQDRHPPLKQVMLRLMDLRTKKIKILATFLGGQGTINVPSWSPDSRHFAFVSYQMLP